MFVFLRTKMILCINHSLYFYSTSLLLSPLLLLDSHFPPHVNNFSACDTPPVPLSPFHSLIFFFPSFLPPSLPPPHSSPLLSFNLFHPSIFPFFFFVPLLSFLPSFNFYFFLSYLPFSILPLLPFSVIRTLSQPGFDPK